MQNEQTKPILTVGQLARRLRAELVGSGSGKITGVKGIEAAGETEVTFLSIPKYKAKLGKSNAAAVIVGEKIEDLGKPQLLVKDVNGALVKVLRIFAPLLAAPRPGVHPTATVAEDAQIAASSSIGAGVVIEQAVQIGPDTVLSAGCKVGQNSKIGANCRLDSNVVVYHNCTIGNNVIIQANTTIGSTGFGYCVVEEGGDLREVCNGDVGMPKLIPHNGGVVIEDFVEIGANCCLDRAKFGNTVIGAGTKIDNLVQIAHNVVIGRCCLIVAQVGIAGSSRLGDGVVLGGQVGVTDNVEIGDRAMVAGQSGVRNDLPGGQQFLGAPAISAPRAMKLTALTRRLPKMFEQLRQLTKRMEELEAAENDTHRGKDFG